MNWLIGLLVLSAAGPQGIQLSKGPGSHREASLSAPKDSTSFVDDAFVDRAVSAFKARPASERARILGAALAAVEAIDDPYTASLRSFATRARPDAKSTIGKLPWKDAVAAEASGDAPLYENLPFPASNQYRFGFRTVVPVAAGRKGHQSKPAVAPDHEQLRALLRGFPADTDLVLAGVMRALDNDRAADRFACFLECWRDGDDSFYRALDRTAGTQGSVFFFDAMLDDYLRSFVPASHRDGKELRRSNDAAHDAVHTAFLGYRQYRGFREAIAMALVLPPSVGLPGVLSRYESAQQAGEYNLREQVDILLRIHGQDIGKVVAGVTATAPPLPEHLWTEAYSPFPAFSEFYHSSLQETEAMDGDSDALLADQHERRNKIAARIAKAARAALAANGVQ